MDSTQGVFQRALRILAAEGAGCVIPGGRERTPVPDDLAHLALCGLSGPALLEQPPSGFIRAYAAARAALPAFVGQLRGLGLATGTVPVSKPGGVKSLDRSALKYSLTEELPLNLLAGKVVAGSLRELYRLANLALEPFTVRGGETATGNSSLRSRVSSPSSR